MDWKLLGWMIWRYPGTAAGFMLELVEDLAQGVVLAGAAAMVFLGTRGCWRGDLG